jgi:FkbM family methyltransferase
MGWLRPAADMLENLLGVRMARKGNVWTLTEPEQLSRFLKVFDVDCVFDVGANEGQYALRLRKLGYRGQIISFEPNPDLAEGLNGLCSRDPKWCFEPVALDRVERVAEFRVTTEPELASLLGPSELGADKFGHRADVVRKVTVQTRTLGKLFPALKERFGFKRPFLKMDTQGHDLAVAEGAGEFLAQFVGLQSELALSQLYAESASYSRAIEFYRSRGFDLTWLIPNNAGGFPDLHEVDCLMYNTLIPEPAGIREE